MADQATSMPCPVCRVPLMMSERQSVEIDYCPQCRGVWLDRGELDKIIERAAAEAPPAPPVQPQQPTAPHPASASPWGGDRHAGYGYGHKKRKKSFLEELFD